jgi:hypothetical protein
MLRSTKRQACFNPWARCIALVRTWTIGPWQALRADHMGDSMVVSISIRILVFYGFTILHWSIDTYCDGILIRVVSYSYSDMYRGIFSISI